MTWTMSSTGWLSNKHVQAIPSPNYNSRAPNQSIHLLVIHNISLPPGQFNDDSIIELFTNTLDTTRHPSFQSLEGLHVSAHFLIRRNGDIIQFVSTHDRAWHAGISSFQGQEQCNDFSIGIELEGSDFEAFEPIQYEHLIQLSRALQTHHPELQAVQGHQHIAPARKTDPGPFFDWSHYLNHTNWQYTP